MDTAAQAYFVSILHTLQFWVQRLMHTLHLLLTLQ